MKIKLVLVDGSILYHKDLSSAGKLKCFVSSIKNEKTKLETRNDLTYFYKFSKKALQLGIPKIFFYYFDVQMSNINSLHVFWSFHLHEKL